MNKVINDYHKTISNTVTTLRKRILEFEDNYDGNLNDILSTEYFSEVQDLGNILTIKEILNAYINLYNRAIDASIAPEKLQTDDIPF